MLLCFLQVGSRIQSMVDGIYKVRWGFEFLCGYRGFWCCKPRVMLSRFVGSLVSHDLVDSYY